MSSIFDVPRWLDGFLRRWDLRNSRIDQTGLHRLGFLEEYSPTAFWLPTFLILALVYGIPFLLAGLANGVSSVLSWGAGLLELDLGSRQYDVKIWRQAPHLLVCLSAIALHVLICWKARKRWLPRFQWLLMLLLVVAMYWLSRGRPSGEEVTATTGITWSNEPYFHVFGFTCSMLLSVWTGAAVVLMPNPSHLEAIDPVVEGIVHAKQQYLHDSERRRVMPLLLHDWAASGGLHTLAAVVVFLGALSAIMSSI